MDVRVRGLLAAWRRHAVAAALLATAALHLSFLSADLGSDEGGFAMVARVWNQPGSYLYGPQWVDRPPLLIAVFALADHLGPYGTRLVASACAVLLVGGLALAGRLAGGPSAARWAAWVGFALVCTVLFDAQELNGELIAAALVAWCVVGVLVAGTAATRGSPRRAAVAVLLAGIASTSAVLVKQNFVDGLAFAGIYLVLSGFRTVGLRPAVRLLLLFALGALVPVAGALVWAQTRGGVGELFYAMYGFRVDASRVLADYSHAAPRKRLAELAWFALGSGLFTLFAVIGVSQVARIRRLEPLPWAILGTFLVEVVGVVAGGSYWSHYLIALIPMTGFAAGLAARRPERGWLLVRAAALLSIGSTLVVTPVAAARADPGSDAGVAGWLRASAAPGDSLAVPFTHASVIGISGLEPRYPFSWSLPVRTLDPQLDLLVATLSGDRAPTWVVRWDDPHSWRLDPQNRVEQTLEAHYRQVATVCGHPVWLHRGVERTPATHAVGGCSVELLGAGTASAAG